MCAPAIWWISSAIPRSGFRRFGDSGMSATRAASMRKRAPQASVCSRLRAMPTTADTFWKPITHCGRRYRAADARARRSSTWKAGLRSTTASAGWSDTAILLPWASGARLDRRELAELRGQIPSSASTVWRRVFSRCALIELYIAAGHFDEGLAVLGEGISAADRAAFYGPEVHRLEGELRASIALSDPDQAEACFRNALTLAGERGEKSLELRAATSLAQ